MGDEEGRVVPFRPRAEPAPDPHADLHRRTRQAAYGARQLAADQNRPARARHAQAVIDQANRRLIATGRPVPARITIALDARGLEGPGVDEACGTVEPHVDLWECGLEVPTAEQVRALADLTGFPLVFFYQPMPAEPYPAGPVWLCGDRDPRGHSTCAHLTPHWVDARGVLHYNGIPRRAPDGWQMPPT